jgi:hypothetical protein
VLCSQHSKGFLELLLLLLQGLLLHLVDLLDRRLEFAYEVRHVSVRALLHLLVEGVVLFEDLDLSVVLCHQGGLFLLQLLVDPLGLLELLAQSRQLFLELLVSPFHAQEGCLLLILGALLRLQSLGLTGLALLGQHGDLPVFEAQPLGLLLGSLLGLLLQGR